MIDPESPDFANVKRLLDAGIAAQDIAEIADAAAWTYDVNRKPKGKKDGVIGGTGVQVYRSLFSTHRHDPDLEAFLEYRLYSADSVAERIAMSRGAIGPAVVRLIDHGFISKRRDGRQFEVRLVIPSVALTELGERWSTDDAGPNTYAGEVHPPLGKKLLTLYPRPTALSS